MGTALVPFIPKTSAIPIEAGDEAPPVYIPLNPVNQSDEE